MSSSIQVIIGNPPWNVGQKSSAEGFILYNTMQNRIAETYAARSNATNKSCLYDSYKMAIRWASDRPGDQGGIIAFVTSGSWIDAHTDSGLRACLAEEFSSIYVVNLRGNRRKVGAAAKAEGGNIFGIGSRSQVAIILLVRNPAAPHKGCHIFYHEAASALTEDEKLVFLRDSVSINGVDNWRLIRPDRHHDWINPRYPEFLKFKPLVSKDARYGLAEDTIFSFYSIGLKTCRDAYSYSFSKETCIRHAHGMVADYMAAMQDLENTSTNPNMDQIVKRHSSNLKWGKELIQDLCRKKQVMYSEDQLRRINYRPFIKQYGYIDHILSNRTTQIDFISPIEGIENRVICFPELGPITPFSTIIANAVPDGGILSKIQCMPRYTYRRHSGSPLFAEAKGIRRMDNIADSALDHFQAHYQNPSITKDAIFDYVYGILHSPIYRKQFQNNLCKELPRIPLAPNFLAFRVAGATLSDLHLGYESCAEYPLKIIFTGTGKPQSHHYRLTRKAMRFAGNDSSTLIVNKWISLSGIPAIAHEYHVNGRSALGWYMYRYKITRDRKSGITNDPNEWFEKPEDLISAIRRIVTVSVETMRIVNSLPDPF